MDLLLSKDSLLDFYLSDMESDAARLSSPASGTFRMGECNSFFSGGRPGVSNAFGAALWSIDFMFQNAAWSRSRGVNFHGGGTGGTPGDGPTYTPIANTAAGAVDGVRPVYYGIYLFSLAARGDLMHTAVTNTQSLNFSAYSVKQSDGSIVAILNNKDSTHPFAAKIDFGRSLSRGRSLLLTGPTLNATSGYTLGNVEIGIDGSWNNAQWPSIPVSGSTGTVTVPPGSAVLVHVY
jgi:hypothetical protein